MAAAWKFEVTVEPAAGNPTEADAQAALETAQLNCADFYVNGNQLVITSVRPVS